MCLCQRTLRQRCKSCKDIAELRTLSSSDCVSGGNRSSSLCRLDLVMVGRCAEADLVDEDWFEVVDGARMLFV